MTEDDPRAKCCIEIEPSVFRVHETFILGYYRWMWWAWVVALWYVTIHPHAEARIYAMVETTDE